MPVTRGVAFSQSRASGSHSAVPHRQGRRGNLPGSVKPLTPDGCPKLWGSPTRFPARPPYTELRLRIRARGHSGAAQNYDQPLMATC